MRFWMIVVAGFLILPIAWGQQSYLDEFAQKWENATDYTLDMAEAIAAEDYNYRPTPEQLSFQEQLLHTASNMIWLSHQYLGYTEEGFDLSAKREAYKKADYSREETITELKWALDFAASAVESFDPKDLEDKVEFFAGPMSKRQIFQLMNDHHTHHRGQLIVYLRLLGETPPRYRGW